MPTLDDYLAEYDHEHTRWSNKILHSVGIPCIFAGLILLLFAYWRTAAGFFAGGWLMLFLGHRIEGNHPAFFRGPVYFLIGPLWVAKEIKDSILGRRRRPEVPQDR